MSHIDVEFQDEDVSEQASPNMQQPSDSISASSIRRVSVDAWSSAVNLSKISPSANTYGYGNVTCNRGYCRSCASTGNLSGIDDFLASQSDKVSKRYRSLTFRGKFRKRTVYMNSIPEALEHACVAERGLASLNPERFEFNMCWKYWDYDILHVFSVPHLAILKVPLGRAVDSFRLGLALRSMRSLRSLTVTDMPDDEDFLDYFPFLGLGILSRIASLRKLDLSVSNYNRPDQYCETWERVCIEDEEFVKPNGYERFFGALFPRSADEVQAEVREDYEYLRGGIDHELKPSGSTLGPLRLESLRLKRIDVPEWAFKEVFDGIALKELRIPYSDIHPEVWSHITSERLIVLEDVNYELLPGSCFVFFQRLTSIQSLTFTRPPEEYRRGGLVIIEDEEAPWLYMEFLRSPSPLSQGTEWGRKSIYSGRGPKFPTLEALLDLFGKTRLKELLLPADMYDVTADLVSRISLQLPFLQNLTWGFDYDDLVSPSLALFNSPTNADQQEIRKAFKQCFLPNVPNLRKITFLSLWLPNGWKGIDGDNLAFDAPSFHRYIASLGAGVPRTIRYIRYRYLTPKYKFGERQRTAVYYHRQEPCNGSWWNRLGEDESEKMFNEDLTPQIDDESARIAEKTLEWWW